MFAPVWTSIPGLYQPSTSIFIGKDAADASDRLADSLQ
jgi:hypothetical protein